MVTVVTTGHEKIRVTVCLAGRSDGKKMLPYVLVKRKRPVPAIVNQFKGKLIINWSGSTTHGLMKPAVRGTRKSSSIKTSRMTRF
uniref:Transposase n=1 Tax=Ditylenchus dipsaci TaxID=166011 RepID=A0A915D7J7_9BILA